MGFLDYVLSKLSGVKERPIVPEDVTNYVNSESHDVNIHKLTSELIRDEGVVLNAYQDHLGYWTIGIGRLIDKRRGGGITRDEAKYLLKNDINEVVSQLNIKIPWFKGLNDVRKRALCNMAFQMGVAGLLKFKNTLRFIEQGNFEEAGRNARKSLWYKQTPNRAERVIKMIENG